MRVVSIILGVLLVMAGIFMVMTPGVTFASMGWVIGFLLIFSGATGIAQYFTAKKGEKKSKWELFGGIASAVLGGIVLINPVVGLFIEVALAYAFAFWMIFSGVMRIGQAFTMRKSKEKNWGWVLTMAILSVVVGGYALFHVAVSALAIGIMVGVAVMMSGFNTIAGSSATGGGTSTKSS